MVLDQISKFVNAEAHSGYAVFVEAKCNSVYTILSRLDKIERALRVLANVAKINSEKGDFPKSIKYIASVYPSSSYN